MNAPIAVGTVGATLWWIGLALVVLVVVPAVLLVALTLVRTIAEIGRYAQDIRTHGAGLAETVGRSHSLATTPRLAAEVGDQLQRYARTWQRPGGTT